MLLVIDKIMCAIVPQSSRASRDYRVKFPDDVLHDNLAGQLWFGAEVSLAAISQRIALNFLKFSQNFSKLR